MSKVQDCFQCVLLCVCVCVCVCVQSMATAVAQLFMALPHSPSTWSLQHTGVVCFIKDNMQRSYYIRMFDLKVKSHTTLKPRVQPKGLMRIVRPSLES